MPPRKGAKKGKAKKVEKKNSNFVESEQNEQNRHDERDEAESEDNGTANEIASQSDGGLKRGKTKKLQRQLTYTDADKSFEKEQSQIYANPHSTIEEVSNDELPSENEQNESHVSETSGPDTADSENEATERKPAQEASQTDDESDESETDAASPVAHRGQSEVFVKQTRGKLQPKTITNDSGDEEPPKQRESATAKGKSKPLPLQKDKDMPRLESEEDDSKQEDQTNEEFSDTENESQDTADDEPPAKAKNGQASKQMKKPEPPSKSANAKGKNQSKESIYDIPKPRTTRKNVKHDDSDVDEPPAKVAPPKKAATAKVAPAKLAPPKSLPANMVRSRRRAKPPSESEEEDEKHDESDADEPPAKIAPPKKAATAKVAPAKLAPSKSPPAKMVRLKRGAKPPSESEEDEEPVQAKKGPASRKQMSKTVKDDQPKPSSGNKQAQVTKTSKSNSEKSSKAPPKSKGKVTESDHDDDNTSAGHEMSLHMDMSIKATIAERVSEAARLLVEKRSRGSLKEVIALLDKERVVDVKKHDSKIRSQLKQMFADKEIVPVNRLKSRKPSVATVFKMGSTKPKKVRVSLEKRKSIVMAAKKKKQLAVIRLSMGKNAKTVKAVGKASGKVVKKTGKIIGAKKTNKTVSQQTDESGSESYDDEEDVPTIVA